MKKIVVPVNKIELKSMTTAGYNFKFPDKSWSNNFSVIVNYYELAVLNQNAENFHHVQKHFPKKKFTLFVEKHDYFSFSGIALMYHPEIPLDCSYVRNYYHHGYSYKIPFDQAVSQLIL